jgi:cyanate permease
MTDRSFLLTVSALSLVFCACGMTWATMSHDAEWAALLGFATGLCVWLVVIFLPDGAPAGNQGEWA